MSKIGRLPISIPSGVTVTVDGSVVKMKGAKTELTHTLPAGITAEVKETTLIVTRKNDEKHVKALHGLTRALLNNMATGVADGFRKTLELVGTGYRARMGGSKLILSLGFSHEIEYVIPQGIQIQVEGTNMIHISGADKHLVGQTAANIRDYKRPEPYKGKGIKYQGEVIRRKAGKAAKTAAA